MRRLLPRSSGFVLSLSLLVLLLGLCPQTSAAQTPTFDSESPLATLQETKLNTEQQRIDVATAWIRARAQTEMSHNTYREGVRYFREQAPGFYGNFFGDPFYATYDVQYLTLAWERQFAEPDIEPASSPRNSTWFFCGPLSYDPAFGGVCQGIQFAASDFFFLPSGPAFTDRLSPKIASATNTADHLRPTDRASSRALSGLERDRPRPVKEAQPEDNRPVTSAALPSPTTTDDPMTLKIPSEIKTLSDQDIASLTQSLREGLSDQEKVALLRQFGQSDSRYQGLRASGPQSQASMNRALAPRIELLRRASQGRLFNQRAEVDRNVRSALGSVDAEELRKRIRKQIEGRGGNRDFSGTRPTIDRPVQTDDKSDALSSSSSSDRSSSGQKNSGDREEKVDPQ